VLFRSFQITYRDQNGVVLGSNAQTWNETNIGLALGNSGRIEAGGTKSDWPVNVEWSAALTLTRMTTDWQATIRDDAGLVSTPTGSQTANVPAGIVVSLTEFPLLLPLRFAQ
jgi:hypothetical protein